MRNESEEVIHTYLLAVELVVKLSFFKNKELLEIQARLKREAARVGPDDECQIPLLCIANACQILME